MQVDQWDGYPIARERLLDQLAATSNPVVLTGDRHAAFTAVTAREADPDTTIAPEFVTTGLSSKFGDASCRGSATWSPARPRSGMRPCLSQLAMRLMVGPVR